MFRRGNIAPETGVCFPFDLKDGNGALDEKTLSLDFFILSLFFSSKVLGFILEIEINQRQCWHIDI